MRDNDQAGDIEAFKDLKFGTDTRTVAQMKADDTYEEGVIVQVMTDEDRGWSVEWVPPDGDGSGLRTGCYFQRRFGGPVPSVGASIRVYGRFGGPDLWG